MRGRWPAVVYSLLIISFSQRCFSCLFQDPLGNYYNFSRLKLITVQTNKIILNEESYILYLSLCQSVFQNFYFPTKNSDSIKASDPMGIIVKANKFQKAGVIYFENLSQTLDEQRNLKLKLESQQSCNSYSHYLVAITLICSEEESEPVFDFISKSICSFSIKWHTNLGCPIKYNSQNECAVKYKNYSFNLMALWNTKYYKGNLKDTEIYLNFCGPIIFKDCDPNSYGNISLCIINNNRTYNFPQESVYYEYDESKSVIKFKVNRTVLMQDSPSVEISLKCNNYVYISDPSTSTKKHTFKVLFETYLACISKSNYLEEFDEANNLKYKLPQIITKIETENFTYLLNTSSQFGGFAISRNDSEIYSLGSVRTLKINSASKSLDLIYTLGSLKKGNHCSLKMAFICSKVKSGPAIDSEIINDKVCEFKFVVNDPVVCPVSASRGCAIKYEKYAYTYNLESTDLFIIPYGEMIFKINLCGQSEESCNGSKDVSVCLIKKNKEIIIGKRSSQFLTFKNGIMKFELTGEQCGSSENSIAVFVRVICDFGAFTSKPVFENASSSDCVFNFTWRTKQACPEEVTFDCLVNTTKGKIDLNPLRKTSSNYKIRSTASSLFLLNFCGSLWQGENELCRRDSASCLVENGEATTIGIIDTKEVTVSDDGVVSFIFKMNSFELCQNGSVKGTKITFHCDKENKDPEYIGFKDCNYSFIWKNRYACLHGVEHDSLEPQKNLSALVIPAKNISSSHFIQDSSTTVHSELVKYSNPGKENQNEAHKNESLKNVILEYKELNKSAISQSNFTSRQFYQAVPYKNNSSVLLFLNIQNHTKIPGGTCLTNFRCLTLGDNKSINLNYTSLKVVPQTESECDEISGRSFSSSESFCQVPCNGDLCIRRDDSWVSGGFLQQIGPYSRESNKSVLSLKKGGRCSEKVNYSSQIELKCSNISKSNKEFWSWSLGENNCSFTVTLKSPLFCIVRPLNSASNRVGTILIVTFGTILGIIIISLFLYCFCKYRKMCSFKNKGRTSSQDIPLVRQGRKCTWKEL